jgi:hypothetical protein
MRWTDRKILFWCGTQAQYVKRNPFCQNLDSAKSEKKTFYDGEVAFFHNFGETTFNWPKNEDEENEMKG